MKPANFPARKDARRARAIQRFSAAPLVAKDGVTAAQRSALADATVLNRHPDPRAARTKKDRTNFARFGR